jgi:mannose-6-phosphate isomerase-like protein (cupin superfamily)
VYAALNFFMRRSPFRIARPHRPPEDAAMEPLILEASDGETYDTGAFRLRLLAQAPDHPVAVTDSILPPGFPGVVRHRHAQMTDIFYVLDGELVVQIGEEWRTLGPGGFVLVPPGIPHTFANRGSVPTRVLNVQQPAGLEQYLKEAVKRMADGRPWSPAEMAEIAVQYDFEPMPEDG